MMRKIREGGCASNKQVVVEEGGVARGGVDKGGAAAVYKMLIAPLTTLPGC